MIDELLRRVGLKYEDLNAAERETLTTWIKTMDSNQLTVDGVRSFVHSIRDAIEQQLIQEPEFNYLFIFKVANRKQILLKARLQNIMLFEAFLSTPQKAREQIDRALTGFVNNRKKEGE